MTKRRPRTKLYWSRVRFCSIKEVFDIRTFDCVRLAERLGEFDYVRLPNPIQINRTTEVRLSSIIERSIGYAGLKPLKNRWIAEMASNRPEKLANDKEYNKATGLVNFIVKQQ